MAGAYSLTCKVQKALEFYDSVLKPLYGLMYGAEFCSALSFDEDVGTLYTRNARYIRSRHEISLFCSLESSGDVSVMRIFKLPTMMFRSNSVLDMYIDTSISTAKSVYLKEFGAGGEGSESTVDFPSGKLLKVPSVQDIRERTEELNFELLLEIDEKHIIPFIVNSLFNQDFSSVNLNVSCNEETFHVCELAYKQLLRATKEARDGTTKSSD